VTIRRDYRKKTEKRTKNLPQKLQRKRKKRRTNILGKKKIQKERRPTRQES